MQSTTVRVPVRLSSLVLVFGCVLPVLGQAQQRDASLLLRGPVEGQNKSRTSVSVLGQTVQLPRAERFQDGMAIEVYGALRADGSYAVSGVRKIGLYVPGASATVVAGRVTSVVPGEARVSVGSVILDYSALLTVKPDLAVAAGDLIRVGGFQSAPRGVLTASASVKVATDAELLLFGVPYASVSVIDAIAGGQVLSVSGAVPPSGTAFVTARATAGGLVGTNAGGLVGTNAGGLVGTNAGGLVGTNAGGLVGTNAGGLVGTNAGGLVGTNAGGLVGTNAGGLVGTNAGGLVGTNAGGLVGTNAGGLVGTNAGRLVGTNTAGSGVMY